MTPSRGTPRWRCWPGWVAALTGDVVAAQRWAAFVDGASFDHVARRLRLVRVGPDHAAGLPVRVGTGAGAGRLLARPRLGTGVEPVARATALRRRSPPPGGRHRAGRRARPERAKPAPPWAPPTRSCSPRPSWPSWPWTTATGPTRPRTWSAPSAPSRQHRLHDYLAAVLAFPPPPGWRCIAVTSEAPTDWRGRCGPAPSPPTPCRGSRCGPALHTGPAVPGGGRSGHRPAAAARDRRRPAPPARTRCPRR